MTPERWQQVKALFTGASEMPAAEQRAYLEGACGGDATLLAEVESLLAAHAKEDAIVDRPAAAHLTEGSLTGGPDSSEAAPLEPMPERAGPYRLVALLGRGGMADVYAAERDDGAFTQRVAVKVLRRGLDTRDLLARFLRERRILARLEHPAIARLLDGGELADGRPYLAMERVDGLPIHRHAEQRGLRVEERLALLRVACEAVAVAHRSLVVHRDIKPSNVLVTDGGEVKLLDFGIAKLLAPDDEEEAAHTASALRVLTPAYAAPEQRAGGPITTATDVWGLGALAFELLVGEPPLAAAVSGSGDPLALPERPPPRPSARVRALRGDAGEGRRWAARLAGDVDVIVQKALALDPQRRYPSVEALADDLRRHLDGRPVLARADSLGYRARKFVGRHRFAVASSALALLAIFAGSTVAAWQAHEVRRERDVAERARDVAERARDRNVKLVDFMLDDLNDRLEPSNQLDIVADLAGVVLKSLDSIPAAERSALTAAQRARVLRQLGMVASVQGDPKQAEGRVRAAITTVSALARGPGPPLEVLVQLAAARGELVGILGDGGNPVGAAQAAELAIHDWRALVAAQPEDVGRRLDLVWTLNKAGVAFLAAGRTPDARRSHLEAVAVAESLPSAVRRQRDPQFASFTSHHFAARTYASTGELEAAAEHFRTAVAQATALANADPKDAVARHQVSIITGDMGLNLRRMGRLNEAAAAFARALAILEELVAGDSGNTFLRSDLAFSRSLVGRVHELQGNLEAALVEYHADAAIKEELLRQEPDNGSWRAQLAAGLSNEGRVLMGLGRYAEASRRHERALALRERALRGNADDPVARGDVGESLLERGRLRSRLGQAVSARADWVQAAELLDGAMRTSDHWRVRTRYARTLLELGEVERARPVAERLLRERYDEPELLELCRKWGIEI